MQVRRDELCERDQHIAHGGDRVGLQQHVAAGCNHHRIDNERPKTGCLDEIGHRQHGLRVAQHTGLGRRDVKVARDGLVLRANEIGRDRQHAGDADGILRGEGRHDARPIHAQRRERLQIGLQACAARRIGPRRWSWRWGALCSSDLF